VHPVSVILQHPSIRRRFEQALGLKGPVFFFCRVGFPSTSFPPAPKRRNPRAAVLEL
jgi:hypothetical protein